MESINIAPTSVSAAPLLAPPRPAPSMSAHPAVGRIDTATFDGLRWTYRNSFDRVLATVPAAVWAEPEAQGWQRVKQNATREVWRARIDDAVYYLKYYRRRRWSDPFRDQFREPACQAEWNGGIYALRAAIPAVAPEGFTTKLRRKRQTWSLLVTAGVEPAYPLNEYWEAIGADENTIRRRDDAARLIELLAEMIARAHQAGFEHLDMHAANILVRPVGGRRYQTLFVDLHSARLGVPIDDGAVVRNLAQLNQWFRRHSSIGDRLRFLRAYFRWRNEYEHAFDHARPLGVTYREQVRALIDAAERHARRLWAQRDRRLHRDGRYFGRLRLGGGWRAMVFVRAKQSSPWSRASKMTLDRDWWREQLARPSRWFTTDDAADCKDSHSAIIRRAVLEHDHGNLPVIVKRPRARNWRRRLRQALPPSRTMRAWQIGNALLHRDNATARPLAALERRLGPLVLDSILVTEAVPGAVDLEAFLRREHAALTVHRWWELKRELTTLLLRQLRRLQERGFVHRDCKAGNLLVVPHPRPVLLWIDMDGLQRVQRLSHRQRLEPLVRLHVSLLDVPGLTRSDRLRFLKAHAAKFGSDPRAWRQAWREIAEAAESKLSAARKRREWKLRHYGRE